MKTMKRQTTTLAALAAAALAFPFASPAMPASRAYIQRGLVACYDGIDNAGSGTHDSSATTWKNLAGDASLDGTCDSKLFWSATGWSVTGDCKPVTVGSGLAAAMSAGSFTIQFAVKPTMSNKRECFFGQYKENDGISIEHNDGSTKTGFLRWFRNSGTLNSNTAVQGFSAVKITANQFASVSAEFDRTANKQTFRARGDCGDLSQQANKSLGELSSTCESVIGGEVQRSGRTDSNYTSGYGVTFQGTYHAFRLYSRMLEANEVAWNAGLDAVRFNGADAATTLGEGYSYDAATDTLSVTASATATDGGTVAANGGVASSSVSASFAIGESATLAATPDRERGYVFDRWTGDTAVITAGTILTPAITVSADRPVSLVATFRRNGDAADGLTFDLAFTGDKTADGLTFSSSDSETKHGYETADVPLPVYPIMTNANTTCLFFQQPDGTAAGSIFRQDVRRANTAVTGQVATVFVRFRWDAPAVAAAESFPTVVMNGYTSWNNNNGVAANGFAVRMRCGAGETRGYPILLVSKVAPGYQNAGITTTGTAYVNAGKWVDMFVSVYPSPTNPKLSNADIWYCEEPSWNAGGYFNRSEISHRHFGDGCGITNVVTTSAELRFGCEPNPNATAITGADAGKAFRGAIACSKGWNRVLTTNEMWTVMRGLGGVQSFTDLETPAGRTFTTCTLDVEGFEQARNGTATSFLGGGTENLPRWRAMTTTYNTNTLLWDAPKDADPMPVIYWTTISNVKSGNTHPVHLEVNGTKVWPTDAASKEVAKGEEIRVEIGAEFTYPGLNELKWVYDTATASNWMIFDHHRLKLVTPPNPFVLVVR